MKTIQNSLGEFLIEEHDGDIFILKREGDRHREAYSGFRNEDDASDFLLYQDAVARAKAVDLAKYRELARAYRLERGDFKAGYIVICELKPVGWTLDLTTNEHGCLPGCVAVPEGLEAPLFVAEGGNYMDGAERWVPMECDGERSADHPACPICGSDAKVSTSWLHPERGAHYCEACKHYFGNDLNFGSESEVAS